MTAEYRTEQPILHPAHIEFLKLWILGGRACTTRIIRIAEETTNVSIEVGIARQRIAQACRYLLAQHVPRRVHIATPHIGTIMLLTGIRRARHNENTLATVVFALRLVYATNGL